MTTSTQIPTITEHDMSKNSGKWNTSGGHVKANRIAFTKGKWQCKDEAAAQERTEREG